LFFFAARLCLIFVFLAFRFLAMWIAPRRPQDQLSMPLVPKYEKADRTTNHKGNGYSQHVPPV
jgi:hypothetical protein